MRATHLDTDFLVYALGGRGPERDLLFDLADSDTRVQMSAGAWYEFCRGPRTAEQLAVARSFFRDDGILPLTEEIAELAGEIFRRLGSPRRRAADVSIAATAIHHRAQLVSRNTRDFDDLEDLDLRRAE